MLFLELKEADSLDGQTISYKVCYLQLYGCICANFVIALLRLLRDTLANAQYPCCFPACKLKFTKYNALKAHVYRHHKRQQTYLNDLVATFVCNSSNCQQKCPDMNKVLSHLRSYFAYLHIHLYVVHLYVVLLKIVTKYSV